jgi:hypothetical protein
MGFLNSLIGASLQQEENDIEYHLDGCDTEDSNPDHGQSTSCSGSHSEASFIDISAEDLESTYRHEWEPKQQQQQQQQERASCSGAMMFSVKWSQQILLCSLAQAQVKEQGLNAFRVFAAPAAGPRSFVSLGFDSRFASLAHSGRLSSDSKWLVRKGEGWGHGGGNLACFIMKQLHDSLGARFTTTWTHDSKRHMTYMTHCMHADAVAVGGYGRV